MIRWVSKERIHWGWLPASALFGYAVWREEGWLPALLGVATGLGLVLLVRWRHRDD